MMSLTGLPLFVLCLIATLGALTLVIVLWRRLGRFRVAGRTLGIVLCEALALASLGLAVNRNGDFYPTWSALLGGVRTRSQPHALSTNLTDWLHARTAEGERDGLVFTWKPPTESAWHLAAAPIVYLPPAYFHRADSSFPVAVVVAPASLARNPGAWGDRGISRLVASTAVAAMPAVVVLVRPSNAVAATSLSLTLRRGLPARLGGDLRVTAHSWAIIGVGAEAPIALEVYAHEPGRFSALGLLAVGSTPLPAGLVSDARRLAPGSSVLVVAGATPHRTAGRARSSLSVAEPPGSQLATVLAWAYAQMPPALAAPLLADLPLSS